MPGPSPETFSTSRASPEEHPPAPGGFLEALFCGGDQRALPGDTAVSPAVSCRCPLVETGEISEEITCVLRWVQALGTCPWYAGRCLPLGAGFWSLNRCTVTAAVL